MFTPSENQCFLLLPLMIYSLHGPHLSVWHSSSLVVENHTSVIKRLHTRTHLTCTFDFSHSYLQTLVLCLLSTWFFRLCYIDHDNHITNLHKRNCTTSAFDLTRSCLLTGPTLPSFFSLYRYIYRIAHPHTCKGRIVTWSEL